jgi:hypothetical protein
MNSNAAQEFHRIPMATVDRVPSHHHPQGVTMKLIRVLFFGLAVLLPTAWTVAKAADEAPAETKKEKKTKKSKKADKAEKEAETKAE